VAKDIKTIVGEVEVHKIPIQVEIPVYTKVKKPDYVLVKEEIVYKVPKVEFEKKTYERPIYKDKVYEIPVYKEVTYVKPVFVEKTYEVPVYVEKVYEIPKVIIKEKVKVKAVETEFEVKVPRVVKENVKVINAVIEDKNITHANIKHVTIEALHPKYICGKCRKEEVNASQTTSSN